MAKAYIIFHELKGTFSYLSHYSIVDEGGFEIGKYHKRYKTYADAVKAIKKRKMEFGGDYIPKPIVITIPKYD